MIKAKTKPYQVPRELYEKLENKAKQIRKTTGENVTWSKILRKILEKNINEQ
jgi:predicted DNA-binding protein